MTNRTPFDFATARYRRAYETADRQLAARLVAAFDAVIADLEREAARIVASLDGEMSVSQAMRLQRTAALIRQAETEIGRLIPVTRRLIVAGEIQGAKLGATAAEGLTAAASGITAGIFPGFHRLPTRALIDLAAALDSNTPLGARLDQLGDTAAQVVREGLEAGLGAGRNPNVVASRISGNLVTLLGGVDGDGVPRLGWLQQMSRSSLLNAYRSANIATYAENQRVLEPEWRWSAALDGRGRTCISCITKHGQTYPLSTPFSSHRACRCAAHPVTRRQFGGPVESGESWLRRQSPNVQAQALGVSGAERWRSGEYELHHLLEPQHDPIFGAYKGHGSIDRAVQRAQARRVA